MSACMIRGCAYRGTSARLPGRLSRQKLPYISSHIAHGKPLRVHCNTLLVPDNAGRSRKPLVSEQVCSSAQVPHRGTVLGTVAQWACVGT
eukprot:2540229-Pyramimonas_sp.AAC.3